MIQMRIDLPTGVPKKMSAVVKDAPQRIAFGVSRACLRLNNQIKKNLTLGGRVTKSRAGRNTSRHLRVQTGDLLNSWMVKEPVISGPIIEGHVFTRVPYAAIHEYGGDIAFAPRSFLRGFRMVPQGRRLRREFTGRFRQGATSSGWSVHIPKRPYVDPAMTKVRPAMEQDIIKAFMRPLK